MPGLKVVDGKQVPDDSWYSKLIRSANGTPKPILGNCIIALRDHPEWAGVLRLDTFASKITAKGGPIPCAGTWRDHETRLACAWLQELGIAAPVSIVHDAVLTVAHLNPYHPVRDYLESLVWDKTPRLNSWLSTYLGVATPSDADESGGDYVASAGRCWLISAVARIYQPGCRADCVLILEGPQGILKSSSLKVLAGEWFTDDIAGLGSKDASQQVEGVWILEIGELEAFLKADPTASKVFLSRGIDRYRKPYARLVEEHPRQSVFAASTNDATYFRDFTGNRRFWPVKCESIDVLSLKRDRDQLWAEATALYRNGEPWWFTNLETVRAAESAQADRLEVDAWDGTVMRWLENPEQRCDSHGHPVSYMESNPKWVTTRDVLVHALGIEEGRITRANQMVAASILVRHGGNRRKVKVGTRTLWVYEFPPEDRKRWEFQ